MRCVGRHQSSSARPERTTLQVVPPRRQAVIDRLRRRRRLAARGMRASSPPRGVIHNMARDGRACPPAGVYESIKNRPPALRSAVIHTGYASPRNCSKQLAGPRTERVVHSCTLLPLGEKKHRREGLQDQRTRKKGAPGARESAPCTRGDPPRPGASARNTGRERCASAAVQRSKPWRAAVRLQ